MSQTTLVGKIVAAQQLFDNGSFKKQTLIIETVSGSYTSYYPIDFTQNEIQTLLPQVQMGMTYQFTGYLQGSKNMTTDRNNNPAAYLSFSVKQVAPAQSQAPAANSTVNNAAQQPGFNQQPQGGFMGQPQQQAPQGFSQQPAQQQPNQGFATPNTAQPGFNNTAPQGFGQDQQPQQTQPQGFGFPPANGGGFGQQ